jgi:hypothetical protein
VNKQNKKDLWAMMSPDAEQLLAEALAKTDEDVAESLRAQGYNLDELDASLIGLVNRLPPRRRTSRGFVGRSAAFLTALGAVGTSVYAYIVATAAPVVTVGALVTASAPPPPPPPPVTVTVHTDAKDGGAR